MRGLLLVAGIVVTLILLFIPSMRAAAPVSNLSFSAFSGRVTANQVATATIDPNGAVSGQLKGGGSYKSQIPLALQDNQLTPLLQQHQVAITGTGPHTSAFTTILSFLPLVFFLGLFLLIGRGARRQVSGITGIGASRAKLYDVDKPSTRFSDVAGYEGAKQEVSEVVSVLKDPGRYERAGAVGPRGVLLVGPPGTGKTLLARAVAGEAGVPFFAVSGSSFVELFVGVGASRARDLFAKARKQAPSIIFIDEIDAIGQRRGINLTSNDEREQTLNQLLAEMDGFDAHSGVVVMAATNRPETLDPALLRPGRFDRRVEIPLPNRAERAAILRVHTAGRHLATGLDLDAVSRGTPGFSGADLANLVNEAAIVAVRDDRAVITAADFSEARDRIILGRREASNALSPEEKHAVAVHESGHALVAALSPHADPIAKVTILPAGMSLGATELLPADERRLYPESYLQDSLAVRLGGRAAESIVLGEPSSGAANDLEGATELATHMVREFGMSSLGPVGFAAPTGAGLVTGQGRPYAEGTQWLIDEEVIRLLRDAEQRALELLRGHRGSLEQLSRRLVEVETIDGAEVYDVLAMTPSTVPSNGQRQERVAYTASSTKPYPPASQGRLRTGTHVRVRNRFDGSWASGFEVERSEGGSNDQPGYLLRRVSDGSLLAVRFDEGDVQPDG
ncbi:MAG TPA: ATP-dependent zinc metalloprotease FtsH [Acidimicrobiales bacterium]